MRTCVVTALVAIAIACAGTSTSGAEKAPPGAAGGNPALERELRALRAQLEQANRRLRAIEKRLGSGSGRAGPSAPASRAVKAGAAGSQRPIKSGAASGPQRSIERLLIRPGTAPGFVAGLSPTRRGREPAGVIVPGIQGVPKVFIPDIGGVADFTFGQSDVRRGDPRFDPRADKFRLSDAQVIFFAPIDPYTTAQISLDKPADGAFDVEEAFLVFNKLPWDLALRIGQFRPRFGLVNGLDSFQLPMASRPQALARFIGEDGLVEQGMNLTAFVPNPWDADVKLDLNVLNGDNLLSFGRRNGRTFDFAYLGSVVYSQDIFNSGSLSMGASFMGGPGRGGQSYLQDAFLKLQYVPNQRNIWTWSIEGLLAERQDVGDRGVKRGIYSLLDYQFRLRYHLGLLIDVADRPNTGGGTEVGFSPILTYFVSDNTRLRLQYTYSTASGPERARNALILQTTFSLGNLKPLE